MTIFHGRWAARRRRWRAVAERGVRPERVVVDAPALDHDLCLLQRVEDLAVDQFVPELAVERFAVAVRPWTSRFDIERLAPAPARRRHFRVANTLILRGWIGRESGQSLSSERWVRVR